MASIRDGEDPGTLRRVARWCELVTGRGACAHPDGAAGFIASALRVFAPELSTTPGSDPATPARLRPCSPSPRPRPSIDPDRPGPDRVRRARPLRRAAARADHARRMGIPAAQTRRGARRAAVTGTTSSVRMPDPRAPARRPTALTGLRSGRRIVASPLPAAYTSGRSLRAVSERGRRSWPALLRVSPRRSSSAGRAAGRTSAGEDGRRRPSRRDGVRGVLRSSLRHGLAASARRRRNRVATDGGASAWPTGSAASWPVDGPGGESALPTRPRSPRNRRCTPRRSAESSPTPWVTWRSTSGWRACFQCCSSVAMRCTGRGPVTQQPSDWMQLLLLPVALATVPLGCASRGT